MEAAADPSALILSRLEDEGSDYTGLYSQVSSFVLPFATLIPLDSHDLSTAPTRPARTQRGPKVAATSGRRKKTDKGKAEVETDHSQLRILAKKFLPFLSRVLKLLPSLLLKDSDGSGLGSERGEDSTVELFAVYRLTLDCLQCITPCLVGKPYAIHAQRGRLVHCLEACGRYTEAEEEAYLLLESLKSVTGAGVPNKTKRGKLPEPSCQFIAAPSGDFQGDTELSLLIVNVIVNIVGSTYKRKTTDNVPYERIMTLVEEVCPWLRHIRSLDEEEFGNKQAKWVNMLFKCAAFLARESVSFDTGLVVRFCMLALRECSEPPMTNQLMKVASTICSSFGPESETRNLLMLDIVRFCMETVVCECKADLVYSINDIFELVFYCVESTAETNACKTMAKILDEACGHFKDLPTITLILDLYVTGMYISLCCHEDAIRAAGPPLPSNASSIPSFLGNSEEHGLLKSLDLLCLKFLAKKSQHEELMNLLDVDSTNKPSLGQKHQETDESCWHHVETHAVAKKRYKVLPGDRSVALSEKQLKMLNESRLTLLHAMLVGLRVSLLIGEGLQESENCIGDLIKSNWIEPQELKILSSSLYIIGTTLCDDKKIEKASLAYKLCYKALWTHARRISETGSFKFSDSKLANSSLDIIRVAIADACAKSVDILKVAHHCQDSNLDDLMLIFLMDWSVASDKTGLLFSPTCLVRQWVKIMCKDFDNGERAQVPSLSDLFRRRDSLSGFVFEQELSAYQEMAGQSPKICEEMQLRIFDVLLNDVYLPKEFPVKRARLLARKGCFLRATSTEELNSCLQCLREAISLLDDISSNSVEYDVSLHYHLAAVHCLSAHFIQEDSQNLEEILKDVRSALHHFSQIISSDHVYDQFDIEPWDTIVLLCNIFDLMSLKGCLAVLYEIIQTIVAFWKLKNEPFEKCVAFLWGDRRLNHALCSLPINDLFVKFLSKNSGTLGDTADFMVNCVRDKPPLIVALLQKLLPSNFIASDTLTCNSERFLGHKATVEEVESVFSSLVSKVPISSYSSFTAAHLYYDLSERLLASGRLSEALRYSNKALQLREKLLQTKSMDTVIENCMDVIKPDEAICNQRSRINFEATGSEVFHIWPDLGRSEFGKSVIGPWNALSCYLESVLQVAIIYDLVGDGAEAEHYLQKGKKISNSQGLPLYGTHFMCLLGRFYCKKELSDLAKQELDNAKHALQSCVTIISCMHCKLSLEVLVDMHLGDYYRSLSERGSQIQTDVDLCSASSVYKTAIERLVPSTLTLGVNQKTGSDRTNEETNGIEDKFFACENCVLSSSMKQNYEATQLTVDGMSSKAEVAATRRSKRMPKNSKNPLTKNLTVNTKKDTVISHFTSSHRHSPNTFSKSNMAFSSRNCWACSLVDISSFGSLENMVSARLECYRRRALLILHAKLGQCIGTICDLHDVHDLFWKSFSFAFLQNPNHFVHSSMQFSSLDELLGPGYSGSVFPVELAFILYEFSWFFVKNCLSENARSGCSCLSDIELSVIIHWLMQAFVLSHEVGLLHQKVSQLLATLFLLSTLGGRYKLPSNLTKYVSASHWASFFHQASIGTFLNHQYLATLPEKACNKNVQSLSNGGFINKPDVSYLLSRMRRKNFLKEFVLNFFKTLPYFTVVCISFLDGSFAHYIGEAFLLPTFFPAWMLLSRLDSDGPATVILPINYIIEDHSLLHTYCCDDSLIGVSFENRVWQCPWNNTVLDNVAPHYKLILEENYQSLCAITHASTDEQKNIWWYGRNILDRRLCNLLRDMEDVWLGSWKCLLLGQCVDSECLESFDREPTILVLDANIQMLPWENLPILRKQEVYRMPSVRCILEVLRHINYKRETIATNVLPLLDPSNAYYLLNPSGDLCATQAEFEEWFRDQKWKGEAGNAPATEELLTALQQCDLFMYFGHGSGTQYMPDTGIKKLNDCAASLLMGCSSGCLFLKGYYAPQGAPLSYLSAGCPALIANLWDVSDIDINRFSKIMVNSWIHEDTESVCCTCERTVEKLKHLHDDVALVKRCLRTKSNVQRGKKFVDAGINHCRICLKFKITSYMSRARDVCKLPFLTGASPVCYGVPTLVRKKNSLVWC